MSFTADIYKEICTDIAKNSRPNSVYAMRMLKLSNGINIAFSINTLTYMRGAFFSVDAKATANQFPRWKGVDIVIAKLPAYGTDQEYVNVMQLPGSATDIFEIVIENLRSELEKCSVAEDSFAVIAAVLTKWREFFKTDKDLIMSEERQQGLYGEVSLGRRRLLPGSKDKESPNVITDLRTSGDFLCVQSTAQFG